MTVTHLKRKKHTHAELPVKRVWQWATCGRDGARRGRGGVLSRGCSVQSPTRRSRGPARARLLARPRAITRHGPHAPRPTRAGPRASRTPRGSPDTAV
eukprot:scaffold91096_cov62-Phaeocystis_antarctica.AAC.4